MPSLNRTSRTVATQITDCRVRDCVRRRGCQNVTGEQYGGSAQGGAGGPRPRCVGIARANVPESEAPTSGRLAPLPGGRPARPVSEYENAKRVIRQMRLGRTQAQDVAARAFEADLKNGRP